MTINLLTTTNFRNLQAVKMEFSADLNLIVGANGSGKTSLLEAIYTLTTGRSFRTRKLESIISRSPDSEFTDFIVFGVIESDSTKLAPRIHNVGIKKSRTDKPLIKIDGGKITNSATLAGLCPVAIIEPDNISLVTGAPQLRRKFIDWGVFHVEHEFSKLWKNYSLCLKQRNALLRTREFLNSDRNSLEQLYPWDQKLDQYAQSIDTLRRQTFSLLESTFQETLEKLLPGTALALKYQRGWDRSSNLRDTLEKNLDTDLSRGFTSVGPHRMDVRILSMNKPAVEVLSRGQMKLVVLSLYLAQIKVLKQLGNKKAVVMLDDISAELDSTNVSKVFKELQTLGSQIISTTLDRKRTEDAIPEGQEYKMFHVEHGVVKDV